MALAGGIRDPLGTCSSFFFIPHHMIVSGYYALLFKCLFVSAWFWLSNLNNVLMDLCSNFAYSFISGVSG